MNKKLFTVLMLFLLALLIAAVFAGCVGLPDDDKNPPDDQPKPPPIVYYYKDFGAVGDGVTDDFDAIIATHEAANADGAHVSADEGAVYYIAPTKKTAKIKTNTDWGNASFIIDDLDPQGRTDSSKVEYRSSWVFDIVSTQQSFSIPEIKTLSKNQAKLDLDLDGDAVIIVIDDSTKRYIRSGTNQNDGSSQTDVFVVDKKGNVDMDAPIIWDYTNISSMVGYPIDKEQLVVSGGIFTTVANACTPSSNYFARGIRVSRSNTVVENVFHNITAEGSQGSPYTGFINVSGCANVILRDSIFTGHKVYTNIKPTGAVSQGTYDINAGRAINLLVENCSQTNSIFDSKYWGIFTSNYSKNITFDGVTFSRFDAHQGVANATVRNSTLGHQGMNIIGCGTFLVENSKIYGNNIINLRNDYGSTWEGEVIIRNCEYKPKNGASAADAILIGGSNNGSHNFGYQCYMPRVVTIDGLVIDDTNPPSNYSGPKVFANFNSSYTSSSYKETYPYIIAEEVRVSNLTVKSGKPLAVSSNTYMFRNVSLKYV